MKNLAVMTLLLLGTLQASAISIKIESLSNSQESSILSCDTNPGSCKILDQSSSIEAWDCRDSVGKNRCYADVEYQNGTRLRVWGGCYESSSECWSAGGAGQVDPCND